MSKLRTLNIPIAEALGVDVTDFIELMKVNDLQERIDNRFRKAMYGGVNVYKLPYGYTFEYKQLIWEDAVLVGMINRDGAEIGEYVVRALIVDETERTGVAVPKIKRRLVLVGEGMIDLYCDGELFGIGLSHLKVSDLR